MSRNPRLTVREAVRKAEKLGLLMKKNPRDSHLYMRVREGDPWVCLSVNRMSEIANPKVMRLLEDREKELKTEQMLKRGGTIGVPLSVLPQVAGSVEEVLLPPLPPRAEAAAGVATEVAAPWISRVARLRRAIRQVRETVNQ